MNNKTGIELIAQERKEQIEKHGYNTEWDFVENSNRKQKDFDQPLIQAAYAILKPDIDNFPGYWSWESCQKMVIKSYAERLAIAGAFIAAEIDRVNYLENELCAL